MIADPAGTLAADFDDRSIALAVAAGDAQAFEQMMRRYNRRLYRLARAVLRDDAEAEDAVQDAYLCAYRGMAHFRGEAALSTWLSRLVLNECLARTRRNVRRNNVIPMVSAGAFGAAVNMCPDEAEPPDKRLARSQVRELLEHKLDELPEAFRTVFVLRAVEEASVEETAECLGISHETVRSRHFRAKNLLRQSLARDLDLAERDAFDFGGAHCDRIVASVLARLRG